MFTTKQDRMIWKAAMLAFSILKDRGMLDCSSPVLLVWNAECEGGSAFPPGLVRRAEDAVVDRVGLIRSRWNLGQPLCPELGLR